MRTALLCVAFSAVSSSGVADNPPPCSPTECQNIYERCLKRGESALVCQLRLEECLSNCASPPPKGAMYTPPDSSSARPRVYLAQTQSRIIGCTGNACSDIQTSMSRECVMFNNTSERKIRLTVKTDKNQTGRVLSGGSTWGPDQLPNVCVTIRSLQSYEALYSR